MMGDDDYDDDDLFGWSSHARRSDPDTSYEAIPENITEQAIMVLRAYRDGAELIDEDAYARVGMDGHQRCSDLRHAGYIERCGRGRTRKDKAAYKCRITPAGLAYLAVTGGAPSPVPAAEAA